jgi:hypothetical protein
MDQATGQRVIAQEVLNILDETFETHHGIYLDEGTSLFETLGDITAAEASVPVGGKCATLAAQVEHTGFFLEVLERHIRGEDTEDVDWGEIWGRVAAVTPANWKASQQRLRTTYERTRALLENLQNWADERSFGGALAIVVHSAYHLGEIRQALCSLRK